MLKLYFLTKQIYKKGGIFNNYHRKNNIYDNFVSHFSNNIFDELYNNYKNNVSKENAIVDIYNLISEDIVKMNEDDLNNGIWEIMKRYKKLMI